VRNEPVLLDLRDVFRCGPYLQRHLPFRQESTRRQQQDPVRKDRTGIVGTVVGHHFGRLLSDHFSPDADLNFEKASGGAGNRSEPRVQAGVEDLVESVANDGGAGTASDGPVTNTPPRIHNLTGSWMDTDGLQYTFEQQGTDLYIQGFDPFTGMVTVECQGVVSGNQVGLQILTPTSTGSGQFVIADDGSSLSGTVADGLTGYSSQVHLVRMQGY